MTMLKKSQIEAFCNPLDHRMFCRKPFAYKGCTYALDGSILLQVEQALVPTGIKYYQGDAPDVQKTICTGYGSKTHKRVPDFKFNKPPLIPCTCDAGVVHDAIDKRCPTCLGTGEKASFHHSKDNQTPSAVFTDSAFGMGLPIQIAYYAKLRDLFKGRPVTAYLPYFAAKDAFLFFEAEGITALLAGMKHYDSPYWDATNNEIKVKPSARKAA